jgi:flagellar protein FliS
MALRSNPVSAYKETSVRTASGGKIIVMLYDEAVKQIDAAISLIESKTRQLDQINNSILKAQDIVTELMVSLDLEKGGDIASKLFGLYRYFVDQLMEGNIHKDIAPLKNVRDMMAELRTSWRQIADTTPVQGTASGGLNIAG